MTQGRALTMDGEFLSGMKTGAEVTGTVVGSGGVLVSIGFIARWFFNFVAGRQDVSHTHLMQIVQELQEEVKQCREREDEGRKREAEMTSRIAALEGAATGIGGLRQSEQRLRAVEEELQRLIEGSKA